RLCLGKSFWYVAVQRYNTSRVTTLSDEERKLKLKQMAESLQKAVEQFDAAEQLLLAKQRGSSLSPEEAAQLYLGSWAAAESNFYLGRFEEAVRRYTVLADRHPQQVEELAALSQIWH